MKNPDFLPPWGCPWHGLIKNDHLHLPNGEAIVFPQPGGGDTNLIDLGMPEVTTSQDQQDQGMAWSNKAILSGPIENGRPLLHGAYLERGSWIWQDDNGANWMVSGISRVSAAGDSYYLKTTRFGVICGKNIVYEKEMSAPDFSAHSPPNRSGYYEIASVSPKGNKVLLKAIYNDVLSFWAELELSGTGDDAQTSIRVVKDYTQLVGTLQTTGKSIAAMMADGTFEWYRLRVKPGEYDSDQEGANIPGNPPVCEVVQTITGGPNGFSQSTAAVPPIFRWKTAATYSAQRTDVIFLMCYDSNGEIVEFSADFEITESNTPSSPVFERTQDYEWVEVSVPYGNSCTWVTDSFTPWAVTISHSEGYFASVTAKIKIDGVEAFSLSDSISGSRTSSRSARQAGHNPVDTGGNVHTGGFDQWVWTASNGKTKTERYNAEPSDYVNPNYSVGLPNVFGIDYIWQPLPDQNSIWSEDYVLRETIKCVFRGAIANTTTMTYKDFAEFGNDQQPMYKEYMPHPLTNNVAQLAAGYKANHGDFGYGYYDFSDNVATPTGAKYADGGGFHDHLAGGIKASYNPITGQVVRTPDGKLVSWV